MPATTTQQWVCPACRHANAMDADGCDGCGASFASLLRERPPPSRRRAQLVATGVREIGVVLGLFVLWKVASAISISDTAGAFARGRWIWRLEHTLRLPSELSVQRGVLGHPGAVQLLNGFYLAAHLGSIVIFLPWLFLRHRARYAHWRNIIATFTGLSLLIQLLSVAPPRLLPGFGFIDTAALYHQSAYQHLGPGMVDQLSSMPSIHVGWALGIAVAVIRVSTSRWRWLVIAHPVLTGYAVVATANHFWLDGVAAALVLAVVMAGSGLRRRQSRASTKAQPTAETPAVTPS